MDKWFSLALGSLLGGFSRYVLAHATYKIAGREFPYGTLAVNLAGCLIVGFLHALDEKLFLSTNQKVLLMTGFCGAFTTFSALILDTSNLMEAGGYAKAFTNIIFSVILGLALFRAGTYIGKVI